MSYSKKSLNTHNRFKHTLPCPFCAKRFLTEDVLEAHKNHECESNPNLNQGSINDESKPKRKLLTLRQEQQMSNVFKFLNFLIW